jgi:PPM family protein phosphatase
MATTDIPTIDHFSSPGSRLYHCDSTATHTFTPSGVLAGAIVDGTGNSLEVSQVANLMAQTVVRVGARKGALAGLLAATELVADPTCEFPAPDGVGILAVCRPGQPTVIAHVGDCAAFSYDKGDNDGLRRLTEDQTKGQRMRLQGEPEAEAATRDHIISNSIGRATLGTIRLTETMAQTVILTSDGVHKRLSLKAMSSIVRAHHTDPTICAQELVQNARSAGVRDDASALVLTYPAPRNDESASWGR